MTLQTTAQDERDEIATCSVCGCDLEWEDCWNGCDEGYFDGYDDDPLWYDPGDLILCSECGGRGGYLACPNAEHHERAETEESETK